MCGRITLTRPNLESIAAELDVEPMNYRGYPIFEPHYNIAPTSILPILTLADGHRRISPMKWGLILGAKQSPVINLRA
jgi:putative SOS response-associated peptidase YedK